MKELSSELVSRTPASDTVNAPVLVHGYHAETIAERTQHLVSIHETARPDSDSLGDKLLREAQVVTWGIGGAFCDVVENPLSKAPEAATAGVLGVGLRSLERAGTKGKVLAGFVGAGMAAKMGYDEWRGARWSEFGGAMSAAWESKNNFYSSVEATKHSVGSLAVDMTVGTLAYKAAGLREPIGNRSNLLTREEVSLSFLNPVRPISNVTELSLMGQRTARALGEPTPSLRMIARPAATSELLLMGERCTTVLNEIPNRNSSLGSHSLDALRSKPHDSFTNARDLANVEVPTGKPVAKPSEPILDKVAHPATLTDALKTKLLTVHAAEEFGYLSAIREVTAAETTPGFVPSRRAYQSIAETLESFARLADPDYAQKYHAVAELVKIHAQTFSQ